MTVYYVDQQHANANDANTGTEDNPFLTIQAAVNSAAAGDTVHIKEGVYSEFDVTSSGEPGNRIVIESWPGNSARPIIDGRDESGRGIIEIDGQSHIEVRGLDVRNGYTDGIYVQGSVEGSRDIIIDDNVVYHTGNAGIYAAGLVMGSTIPVDEYRLFDVVISNNDVSRTNEPDGGNEAITLGGGVNGFQIFGNHVHNTEQFGIDIKLGAINGSIHNNLIHDIEKHGIYVDAASRAIKNVDIYDNTIYNTRYGLVIARESDRDPENPVIDGIRVFENEIYNNEVFGILVYRHVWDQELGVFTDVTFRENVVYNNGQYGIRLVDVDFATDIALIDNIVYDNPTNVSNKIGANETGTIQTKPVEVVEIPDEEVSPPASEESNDPPTEDTEDLPETNPDQKPSPDLGGQDVPQDPAVPEAQQDEKPSEDGEQQKPVVDAEEGPTQSPDPVKNEDSGGEPSDVSSPSVGTDSGSEDAQRDQNHGSREPTNDGLGGPTSASDNKLVGVEITGAPFVGQSLVAEIQTTNLQLDSGQIDGTYQWLRDGEPIVGATTGTYFVTEQDINSELTVRFTVTGSGASDEMAESISPGPVTGPFMQGTNAADQFLAGDGMQVIDGGAGVDIVALSGDQTNYTVSLSAQGIAITDRTSSEGVHLELRNIEVLDFESEISTFDGSMDLRDFTGHTQLDAEALEAFVGIYIAYFNRAPDAVGLAFWGTAYAEGMSLEDIAIEFASQPETQELYSGLNHELKFISEVYQNVLGRAPDFDGLMFWSEALRQDEVTRGEFILEVIRGVDAETSEEANSGIQVQKELDKQYLETKLDLGAYFAVALGMSNTDNASTIMDLYDGTVEGTNAAVREIDSMYQTSLNGAESEFLMPLIGVLENPFVG